ncbi:uroporphyrinogen-III C-methyltransferase [Clostridium senegalense]|uniref:uroporphyrinogen-III C-methyltransferase n=1 Tax=Clostridium senegalense TaxID=1465809 RepID=A0A6M0H3R0_9CLOT|nr:uroporphyrinogen-III C-methyltransferase [Clostridium senegalense]NEU05167.1 uroporphyrinogen-III C-methyltransferase [Clostridium senegalense]
MSKVYLIGAGPGHEELITLRAVNVLKNCSAIMYDRLCGESFLKYVNSDAKIYYCGKEPGCHYKTQEEINDMIVSLAKKGHTVGRVKGGDPYIFGRGGEEALRLLEEDIEFEVVPGVTSPISVLNYGGIPVTHRGIARGFHIFTAKSKDNMDLDFPVISKLKGTLIFMMGFEKLGLITNNLIENGMDKNTPCAVVMRGTTSKQKKAVGTLENIKEKALENGLANPSIIVVGDVVKFHDKLNWFEKKPLFGKNICITRTKNQSREIREKLVDLGGEVTEINSIKIKPTSEKLTPYIEKLSHYDYVVITSANAANIFFNYLIEKEIDIRNIKAKFITIGPASDKAIRKFGVVPILCAKEYVAENLFEHMKEFIKENDKILLPRSKKARTFLVEALESKGCIVDECHIYEPELGDAVGLNRFKECDVVVFTSPSTVINMIELVSIEEIRNKTVLSIGPITSVELNKNNIEHIVCDKSSNDGMIDKLIEIYNK